MDIFEVFEKSEWEYPFINSKSQNAKCGDIEIFVANDILVMEQISPNFDELKVRTDVLRMIDDQPQSIFKITKKLSKIKQNQEKIKNIYEYISALKDIEHLDLLYLHSTLDYSPNSIYNSPILHKIQKYLFDEFSTIYVPKTFISDTYNKFCKEDKKILCFDPNFVLESLSGIPIQHINSNLTSHKSLEIIDKMEKILESY